jgi:WD40 repeat protein
LFLTLSENRAEVRESGSLRVLQSRSLPISLYEMHADVKPFLWNRPKSTAIAPHATLVAFATESGPIELWDGPGWHKIADLPSANKKPADWLTFSPDGEVLATRESGSETITLWNLTNVVKPQVIATFQPCQNNLCLPVFCPDGDAIATMGADERTAEIWNLHGRRQAVYRWHKQEAYRLAFSRDGRLLATSSADGTAAVWEVKNPERPLVTLRGQLMNATALAFSPDGQRLAAGNAEGTIKLYDFAREQELTVLRSHKFGECLALFFIDDDTLVARIEDNVVVWRAASTSEIDAEDLRRAGK